MANGLPYAIAAQIAYPERQCIAFVGDGGFSMLMAEFATAVKYQLPIKVIIIKNNILGMIKWEQMVFLGNPEFGCDLQPIAFVAFAKACGGTGMAIENPVDCGRILDRALATPGPVIVEAIVDPFTPPMPAKITLDQARKFAESLARGEPNRSKMPGPCFQTKCESLFNTIQVFRPPLCGTDHRLKNMRKTCWRISIKPMAHLNLSFMLFLSIGFLSFSSHSCTGRGGDFNRFEPCSKLCTLSGRFRRLSEGRWTCRGQYFHLSGH